MNCSYKRPWSTSCFYGIVISSEISTCNLLQKNTWWVKLENKWMNEWMTSGHVSLFNISLRWVKESLHWKSGLLWLELLTCVLFTSYTNQGRFITALMKLKKVLIFCKYYSLSWCNIFDKTNKVLYSNHAWSDSCKIFCNGLSLYNTIYPMDCAYKNS